MDSKAAIPPITLNAAFAPTDNPPSPAVAERELYYDNTCIISTSYHLAHLR